MPPSVPGSSSGPSKGGTPSKPTGPETGRPLPNVSMALAPDGTAPLVKGEGKPLRSRIKLGELDALMRDISACRADLLRRETAVADLQRRLQAELQPLRDAMLDARVETFRVLGKHLRAGWLNKRAHKTLELALYDLANELEAHFGVDLGADRRLVFAEEGIPVENARFADEDDEDMDADGDGEAEGDGSYREEDFDDVREGRGEWAERRARNTKGTGGRAGAQGDAGPDGADGGRSGGKGAGGQRPASEKSKDEALAGDIRALYLMLARALHPDKESDPARLADKTAWMQKVTAAYAARDLARLLDILAANPLDAVGPYLSQAPLKTVQSFAKRLRRELDALRRRLAYLEASLDPLLGSLMKHGAVNEIAYGILLSQARKELKFMKQRRDIYRTTQGLNGLVDALRSHDWRELM